MERKTAFVIGFEKRGFSSTIRKFLKVGPSTGLSKAKTAPVMARKKTLSGMPNTMAAINRTRKTGLSRGKINAAVTARIAPGIPAKIKSTLNSPSASLKRRAGIVAVGSALPIYGGYKLTEKALGNSGPEFDW